MRVKLLISVVILLCIGLQRCGEEKVSADELRAFALDEGNGLLQRIEKGESRLEVIYHPKELVLLQEISGRVLSNKQLDSIRHELQAYDYFLFKLSRNGREIVSSYANDRLAYKKAINYLSYRISADIALVNNDENIAVEDFSYSQTFGSATSTTLLIAFKSSLRDREGSLSFVFNDSFFNTGLSEFQFNVDDIRAVPNVNINPVEL